MTKEIFLPIKLSANLKNINLKISFCNEGLIIKIEFDSTPSSKFTDLLPRQIELTSTINIKQVIANYFSGLSKNIDLPHNLKTKSPFQLKVIQALKNIPYGKQKTYGELASELNTHPRAIGQALKSNPLPLIYPCHRIISKTSIGGFIGQSQGNNINLKHALLELEN